jgi:hypothetical protein
MSTQETSVSNDTWVERHVLSDDEAREFFDRLARQRLGISGEEFVRRYREGEFADDDDPVVRDVKMLINLVDPVSVRRNASSNAG